MRITSRILKTNLKNERMTESNIKRNITIKLFLIYGLMVLALIAVVIKIIALQSQDPDTWKDQMLTIKESAIEPLRGDVCDTYGRVLATSMPLYTVRWDLTIKPLDTSYNKYIDTLCACMSGLFKDKTAKEYKEYFEAGSKSKRNTYFLVKDKVSFTQVNALKKFPIFKFGRYSGGIIIEQNYSRVLPHKSLAQRTIGYVNSSGSAVGMEGAFNDILYGKVGMKLLEKLPSGDYHPVNSFYAGEDEIEPEDGKDVISTINVNIQDIAEKSLLRQLTRHHAKHGCVIVMEVKTGKIRAIANLDMQKDSVSYGEKFNSAVGTAMEPGSTFKLATLITVMEKTGCSIDDSIDIGDGTFTIYNHTIKDDHLMVGKHSIREIFEKSSNVGMSKLVYETFKDNSSEFVDRLYQMHLNKLTGIEIPGEAMPYIKYTDDKLWSGVSLAQMSYGYEVSLSPLQTLVFYNAIANNGVMLKPHLLEAVRSHGEITSIVEPEILNSSICSKETLEKAHILLRGVVENGTAKNIKSDKYSIAGKTGTAQIAKGKSGYKDETGISYLASFVGYFPAEKPKYSCIVVISTPTKFSYYGSTVACPVFKDIADKLYSQDKELHVGKDFYLLNGNDQRHLPVAKGGDRAVLDRLFSTFNIMAENVENSNTPFVYTSKGNNAVRLDPVSTRKTVMPDVRGMGLRDAMYILRTNNLNVTVIGRGMVRKQSVSPGAAIKSGTKVTIELG